MPPAAPSTATLDNWSRCQCAAHIVSGHMELYTFDAVEEKALRLTALKTELADRAANMMGDV